MLTLDGAATRLLRYNSAPVKYQKQYTRFEEKPKYTANPDHVMAGKALQFVGIKCD